MVKAGYGTYEDVKKLNAREVIQALNYEKFLIEYDDACIEESKKGE